MDRVRASFKMSEKCLYVRQLSLVRRFEAVSTRSGGRALTVQTQVLCSVRSHEM